MDTRQRDIFLFIVVNVGAIGWTFFFAKGMSTAMFLVILIGSIIGLNLALFIGMKLRNRNHPLAILPTNPVREIIIQQVSLDPNHRLHVRPILPNSPPSDYKSDYRFIFRDASSVRWDEGSGELYVQHDAPGTPLNEFKLIVAAVAREYGDQLVLSPSTVYVDVPSDMVAALRESFAKWKRPDPSEQKRDRAQ